ncbi:hypothetical protein BDK51DRAFT_49978 [Blyttiomyces helicus]|uniref:F-box domain-containing protein n=1 Tax=Blyttiomyces helicus TaxID=388810 RepID=A0A4P9W328_9FUNG|nr:hypothetical protein BDK51DRAFT_49978 [Blyttiomyces helicus]|eukprot:RKO85020.1 hypothetical protein BDK51DRAFT_49978 [Blyttiomyces helicus]
MTLGLPPQQGAHARNLIPSCISSRSKPPFPPHPHDERQLTCPLYLEDPRDCGAVRTAGAFAVEEHRFRGAKHDVRPYAFRGRRLPVPAHQRSGAEVGVARLPSTWLSGSGAEDPPPPPASGGTVRGAAGELFDIFAKAGGQLQLATFQYVGHLSPPFPLRHCVSDLAAVRRRPTAPSRQLGHLADDSPLRAPQPPAHRDPAEIFNNLPDSQAEGEGCCDLRSAALVCRAWQPAASDRTWTHVMLCAPNTLQKFLHSSRVWEPAAPERTLQELIADSHSSASGPIRTQQPEQFSDLHSSADGIACGLHIECVPLLSSCPHLVVLETSMSDKVPTIFKQATAWDEDRRAALRSTHGIDLDAVASADSMLYKLLMLSIGPPLVKLVSSGPPMDLPGFEADDLTNLEVAELASAVLPRPVRPARHPLRKRRPTRRLAAFMPIHRPSQALLYQPPADIQPPSQPSRVEALKRHLRVRGSNLKVLDLDRSYAHRIDDAFLACIHESAPQLEVLGIMRFVDCRTPPALANVAFIADFKRACPNLRRVHFNDWLAAYDVGGGGAEIRGCSWG